MLHRTKFVSHWYSLWLPPGWGYEHEEGGALFQQDPPRGALQISSFHKELDEVSDDDLLDFIREDYPNLHPSSARCGDFAGFYEQRAEDGFRWEQWWLAAGHLMIFVTYVVAVGEEDENEADTVDEILATLRTR